MALSISTTANKALLDQANPTILPDLFRAVKIGSVLRALPTYLYAKKLDGATTGAGVAGTNKYVVAAGQSFTLPDDAKAMTIAYALARAGTGTTGLLTIDTMAASEPAAGHCKVSPTGDLLFNHTDAWTSVDVVYTPFKYDAFEFAGMPLASNAVTIPTGAAYGGAAVFLLEAESTAGTLVSKMIVQLPGATPSSGQAALSADGTKVSFASADAVTAARIKVGLIPLVDVNALMSATASL